MAQQKIFGITVGKPDEVKTMEDIPLPVTNWKPSLPGVNALPIALVDKQVNDTLIKKFAVAASGVIVATIVAFVVSSVAGLVHQTEVNDLELQSTDLTRQIAELKPYQIYKDNVDAQMRALYLQLEDDVAVANVVADLNDKATTSQVELGDISVSLIGGDASASSCPATDPFDNITVTVGCVTFSGSTIGDAGAEAFINSLEAQTGISDVFISSYSNGGTEAEATGKTFDATLNFGEEYYSKKYASLASGVDAILAAAAAASAPATDPAPATEGTNE